jgi:hypothetical protein
MNHILLVLLFFLRVHQFQKLHDTFASFQITLFCFDDSENQEILLMTSLISEFEEFCQKFKTLKENFLVLVVLNEHLELKSSYVKD